MKDLIPPHHHASEVALLGSMILDGNVIPDVLPIVSQASDFYDEHHIPIFNAILHVVDRTNPAMLDLVMIQKRLMALGVYEKIGGEDKLRDLVESVPSAANATHYATIVAEKAKLRRLIAISHRAAHAAYHVGGDGHDSAQEVVDELEAAVFELGQSEVRNEPQLLSRTVAAEMERMEKATTIAGVPTGYRDLDNFLQGAQAGEVILIGARPSQGKTSLALNMADNIASNGFPVALFSLEMSKSAVTQRLLSSRSGVNSSLLRSGAVGGDNYRYLVRAAGELSDCPIVIDDTSSLTIMELRARARRMVKQHKVGLVMIDYLQLMTAPGARDGRVNEVAVISRGVKALARELNVPVVCLSQLNRASENREENRPRMADLRESGALEQDADVILLLHRPEYYHIQDPNWIQQNPEMAGLAELIVAKNRNGATGIVNLSWDAATTKFSNRTE